MATRRRREYRARAQNMARHPTRRMTVNQIIGYYLKVRYVPIICRDIYEPSPLLRALRMREDHHAA